MLNPRAGQRGTTLLEVLVAALLLALGLLATAGLHARLLQSGRGAQYRVTASQLAMDFADRARANPEGARAGAYDQRGAYDPEGALPAAPSCTGGAACTATQMAARDINDWQAGAAAQLPGAELFVRSAVAAGVSVLDVWVLWLPPAAGNGADAQLREPCLAGAAAPADVHCLHLRTTL